MCHGYMCMVLYMKPIWSSSIPEIYVQLQGDLSAMGMCAYRSIWDLSGVTLFQRSMLNWSGFHLPWVYVHGGLYEIYWVWWLIVFQRSLLDCRGCQFAMGIFAYCSIWNLSGVMVLKRSMLNWGVSIGHGNMCMLFYMKDMWCNVIPEILLDWREMVNLPWVYMQSALYETYLV